MVSDPDETHPSREEPSVLEVDGGAVVGFDEAALFTVIRDAVKDALLDVIGTLLLLGVACVLAIGAGQALVLSTSVAQTAASAVVLAVGVYIAAATLELIPPIRDWV